jgi:hypothetical protein
LNPLRQDWWWLAVVIGIVWAAECVVEGNTPFVLLGPVMVGLWSIAIILIDRWVSRISDRAKDGESSCDERNPQVNRQRRRSPFGEARLIKTGDRSILKRGSIPCSEFGLFRCEGDARPRVHLYACNERVAAILGTEDRCLTLSHIEPVLAQTIDDVRLMGDENGVGAGLR